MKKILIAVTLFLAAQSAIAQSDAEKDLKVLITVGGKKLTATLQNNAASRDLIAQLPVQIHATDYNGAEKIGKLPKPLSTAGAPAGSDPESGDIAFYAPWGNLVFYYGEVGYWPGIVHLGHLDGGSQPFSGSDALDITVERADATPSK